MPKHLSHDPIADRLTQSHDMLRAVILGRMTAGLTEERLPLRGKAPAADAE